MKKIPPSIAGHADENVFPKKFMLNPNETALVVFEGSGAAPTEQFNGPEFLRKNGPLAVIPLSVQVVPLGT